ncbi:hypothetical protein [Nitrosomonas sp.]|uniref:hypothetical protein n=1 Tax=Nitrosomonas sp. TaxID=42353 RepID=UPI0025EBE217|nr:hypothetical protein [Nitrosomonas sp.]
MSAETHLHKLGVTIQQARDFINLNIDHPEVVYDTAFVNGVTISMLSEITNYPINVIKEYFASVGLVAEALDDTSILINSDDLRGFESLIAFNNNSGILSTASLREKVQPLIDDDPFFYNLTFDPVIPIQDDDGIYDSEELGVKHLGDIAATNENIESLFYGTLLNIYRTLDETELKQISEINNIEDRDEFKELFANSLASVPTNSIWTDETLADIVVNEAYSLINDFLEDDFVFGVLDHSFLGSSIT